MGLDEEKRDYFKETEKNCLMYPGIEERDLSEAASYEEDVLVLDNNDIAKKYLLYNEVGENYLIIIQVPHQGITYNFELSQIADQSCIDDFEAMVKSFRTEEEEKAARKGYNIFSEENNSEEQNAGEETAD